MEATNLVNYQLPNELILSVFKNLSPEDLLRTRLVCSLFNQIINDNQIWQPIVKKIYNVSVDNNFNYFLLRKFMETCRVLIRVKDPSEKCERGDKIPIAIKGKVSLLNLSTKRLEHCLPFPQMSANYKTVTHGSKVGMVNQDEQTLHIYDMTKDALITVKPHFKDLKKFCLTDKYLIVSGKNGEKEVFEIENGDFVWMLDGWGNKIENPKEYKATKSSKLKNHDFLVDEDYMFWINSCRDYNIKIYNLKDGSLRNSVNLESFFLPFTSILSFAIDDDKLYIYSDTIPAYGNFSGTIFVYNNLKEPELIKTTPIPLQFDPRQAQGNPRYIFPNLTEELMIREDLLIYKTIRNIHHRYDVLDRECTYKYTLMWRSDESSSLEYVSNLQYIKIYKEFVIGITSLTLRDILLIWSKEDGQLINQLTLFERRGVFFNIFEMNNKIIIQNDAEIKIVDFSDLDDPMFMFL